MRFFAALLFSPSVFGCFGDANDVTQPSQPSIALGQLAAVDDANVSRSHVDAGAADVAPLDQQMDIHLGVSSFEEAKALLVANSPEFAAALDSGVVAGPPPADFVAIESAPGTARPCEVPVNDVAIAAPPAEYTPPAWEVDVSLLERLATLRANDLTTLNEVRASLATKAGAE